MVADRHEGLHVRCDGLPHFGIGFLGREAVGERLDHVELHRPADFATSRHVRRTFRLDANHFYVWCDQLEGACHARDEAAAADRHEHGLHIGQVFEDLDGHGRLSCHDVPVLEWVYVTEALFSADLDGARVGVVPKRAMKNGFGAIFADRGDLAAIGRLRHDDPAGNALVSRDESHRLAVISRGRGDDPFSALVPGETQYFVEHAARLEAAGLLKILGFHENFEPGARAQSAGRQKRRSMHEPIDARARLVDVL